MEDCDGKNKLGDNLRAILRNRMQVEADEREAQRKRREEPFVREAQDFLVTLPAELQRAADEGQEQKLVDFINIVTAKAEELRELKEASHERHQPDYIDSFERVVRDTYAYCRSGGGLKLIEDYCHEQGIIFEPTLDIEGTESAKIKIRFSWPIDNGNDNK